MNEIQTILESLINHDEDIIKRNEYKFKELSDVLSGEKELYHYIESDDLEYLKNASENLYNIYIKEVYQDENAKTPPKDDEYVKALLEDVLSGDFLRKKIVII